MRKGYFQGKCMWLRRQWATGYCWRISCRYFLVWWLLLFMFLSIVPSGKLFLSQPFVPPILLSGHLRGKGKRKEGDRVSCTWFEESVGAPSFRVAFLNHKTHFSVQFIKAIEISRLHKSGGGVIKQNI